MSHRPTRRLKTPHRVPALLLRLVPYGEADAVVTLLTEGLGRVSAMARGARRAKRSQAFLLEPIHTLQVVLDESPGVEMMVLREAKLERVRHRLTRRLDGLEAAGQGLRWARELAPPRAPEPLLWAEIERLLDLLDDPAAAGSPRRALAEVGLRLLRVVGYGFDFRACTRCGKPCPEQAPAQFDAQGGGLVCSACGGGPFRLRPELRLALLQAEDGASGVLPDEDTEAVIDWIDKALAVHASIQRAPASR